MAYCRYCGTQIDYTRTANEKWLPVDVAGQPHFCQEQKNGKVDSGLSVCETCGKPVFKSGKKTMDYTTLQEHSCRKIDITNYQKYLKRTKKTK